MSKELILINGRVYDPKNKLDGETMDIHIADGKIVERWGIVDNISMMYQIGAIS